MAPPVQVQPLTAALAAQVQAALQQALFAALHRAQPQGFAQVTPAVLMFRQPQGQADAALAAFVGAWLHRGQLQRLQAIKIPPSGVGKGRGRQELPPITAYAGAAKVAIMEEREKSGPGEVQDMEMREKLEALKGWLEKRGYETALYETAAQAKAHLLEKIGTDAVVGIGGSMTMHQMGIEDALKARGQTVHWHWRSHYDDSIRRAANAADVYLCSANAVTEDGRIVNIDGYGNRLAATLFGPKKVYMVIGSNKIAEGLEAAMQRAKNIACPLNARRLGLKTPCAALGRCVDCGNAAHFCSATLILDTRPNAHPMEIILVEEELGY